MTNLCVIWEVKAEFLLRVNIQWHIQDFRKEGVEALSGEGVLPSPLQKDLGDCCASSQKCLVFSV